MNDIKKTGLQLSLAVCLLFLFFMTNVSGQEAYYPISDPTNIAEWVLNEALSDEFEDPSLNRDRWQVAGEFVEGVPTYTNVDNPNKDLWKGRGPSQFSGRNYRLEDGKLKLETRWEPDFPFSSEPDNDGVTYENITTACILGRIEFTYGYMEVKCKVADAEITSSFWATGNKQELDMFELFGDHRDPNNLDKDREYLWNLIDWSSSPSRRIMRKTHDLGFRLADRFAVYGIDWSPEGLKFYVDGEQFSGVTAEELGDDWILTKAMKLWFDQETFTWFGIPDSKEEIGTDGTVDYEIEYLRLWQRDYGIQGPQLGNEEILDPGFESGNLDPFWDLSYGNSGLVTENVHSGFYGGYLSGNGAFEQLINVMPNTSYELSCWGKVLEDGYNAYLGVSKYGADVQNALFTETFYDKKTISFTTTDMATTANIWVWNGDAEHKIYVDDFRLIIVGDTTLVAIEGIGMSQSEVDIEVGESIQLSPIFSPDSVSYKTIIWESDDNLVAEVNADGLVTAISEGTATVTVISVENKTLTTSAGITVTPATSVKSNLEAQQTGIIIYPNPYIDGTLSIKMAESADGIFQLFNIQGNNIYEHDFTNKSILDINLSGLIVKPGTYICKILTLKEVYFQKLIIR